MNFKDFTNFSINGTIKATKGININKELLKTFLVELVLNNDYFT